MIDQILKGVKGELASKLVSLGLPESKTSGAINLAKATIKKGVADQVSGGGIEGLTNLFNGKLPLDQSSLVKTMIADYGSKMVSKLGVSDSIASSISTFVIPFVMSKASNQVSGGGVSALTELVGSNNPLTKLKSMGGMFKSFF